MLLRERPDALGLAHHPIAQPVADLLHAPAQTGLLQPPLQQEYCHAAGVREDVRNHGHALVVEDLVGLDRRRPVRDLEHHGRTDAVDVVERDHVLEGRRGENIDVQLEQRGGVELLPRVRRDLPGLALRLPDGLDVESVLGVHGTARVGHRHDAVAVAGEQRRELRARVAESLDRDRRRIGA